MNFFKSWLFCAAIIMGFFELMSMAHIFPAIPNQPALASVVILGSAIVTTYAFLLFDRIDHRDISGASILVIVSLGLGLILILFRAGYRRVGFHILD